MNWFWLTILSAITYAAAEIISKYVSDKKSEPVFIGITAAFFTTIISLYFVGFTRVTLTSNLWAFVGLVASAALVAIGIVTYYEGLKHSDISEFALLSRSRTLMMIIGGIIIFRERFSTIQVIGGILVLYGVFLLSWEGGRFHFNKGAKFALATAFFFAVGFLIDKAIVGYFSAIVYTFLIYFLTVAFMLPLAVTRYLEKARLPSLRTTALLSIVGFLYGVSAYCIYAAFIEKGPASLVSLASQLEIPITVLWGIVILKERKRAFLKLFSMGLLIMGIVLLK